MPSGGGSWGSNTPQVVVPAITSPDGNSYVPLSNTVGLPTTSTQTGTAGNPSTAAQTVQGITGGTPVNVTVTNPSSGPANQNVTVTNATSNPVPVTQTQTGSAGNPNAAVSTIQGITNGTPVVVSGTVTSTPSGTQNVNVTNTSVTVAPPTGPAGTPNAAVNSVQGVTNGTPVIVSGTVTSTPSGTQNVNVTNTNLPVTTTPASGSNQTVTVSNTVSVTQTQTGTAGTPNAAVTSIQGITNGTAVNVTGTVTSAVTGPTSIATTSTSVGTTSTALQAATANAKVLTFQNTGSAAVYLSPTATASATNSPFLLYPSQLLVLSVARGDGAYVTSQWSGLSQSGTNVVSVSVGT